MLTTPIAPVSVPHSGNTGIVPPWLQDGGKILPMPVEPVEPPIVTLPIDEPLLVPADWR